MIGSTILHYNILEKLGEGGMGEVYKAQDTKLDRFVALKFLPSKLTATEDEKSRFIQEAKTASAMNHPNVCTIYSIEEYENKQGDKQLFIAMEFVDGKTLSDKKETLSEKQKLEISAQVAEGLAAAHEKGIVHRDIKPDNIMIRKDGIVQIMDFGLAKLYSSKDISRLTKAGTTLGTMGYMSPEQIQGQDVDHRTDIFSLGVVLYELFAGQSPFKGIHEAALVYEIVNTDVPPISESKPEIDPELDRLILECLEKDPPDRCQSAAELARNLRKLKRVSTGSRTASRIQQAVPVAKERKQEIKKWKMTSIALAVLCVSAIAVIFYFITLPRPGNDLTSYKYTPFETDGVTENGAWSPDGKSIVFTKYHEGIWQLLLRSIDNSRTTLLSTRDKYDFYNLFWAPDGNSIYFMMKGRLKNIGLAGGNPRTLFKYQISAAAISPDNKALVYWTNANLVDSAMDNFYRLFISTPEGGKGRFYKPDPFSSKLSGTPTYIHFSPDGSKIALGLIAFKASELWILPWPDGPDAKPFKIFKNIKWKDGLPKFEWLADSKNFVLAFNGNMCIANTESGKMRKITESVINENLAAVSPDRKRLLIQESNANYDIVMLPFDGSPLKRVKATSVNEYSATVSGDGKLMSYITNRTGRDEIWLENEAGNEYPVVTNADFIDSTISTFPAAEIAPDGKHIAFFRFGGGKSLRELWVSNSEGGKPVPVVAEGKIAMGFCWSPDGNSLYVSYISNNNTYQKIIPLGNGKAINLPDSAYTDVKAAWSPNGKWIAFPKYHNSEYAKDYILLLSPDGKKSKFIISPVSLNSVFYNIAWSRNSKLLYIASSTEKESRLDAIDIETGKSRKIASYGFNVDLSYDQTQCAVSSISRDRKGLLVSARFANGSLYILDGALVDE
jgi:eukaryotic-like serine/threonine-protein kinase